MSYNSSRAAHLSDRAVVGTSAAAPSQAPAPSRHLSVFSVVVRMTSPDGNRYESNIHVEARNEAEARVRAEADARENNQGWTCMARSAKREARI